MDNKIIYSKQFQKDVKEIRDYICNELHNPIAAKNTVKGIFNSIDKLKLFPKAGTEIKFYKISAYRYIIYKNYMIIYHIKESDIYVYRVIYKRRDYIKLLFGEN